MQALEQFKFNPGLQGSARGVSLVRILLAALAITRCGTVFHQYDYLVKPLIAVYACAAYVFVLALLVGFWSRAAAFGTAIVLMSFYYYTELGLPLKPQGTLGQPSNLYFLGALCFLLSLTPCGDVFSVDSYGRPASEKVSLRGVQLIRLMVCAMYFWTAAFKINPLFLSGQVLELTWIYFVKTSYGYIPSPTLNQFFAIAAKMVVPLEFSLSLTLFFPKSRKVGIAVGSVFHILAAVFIPVQIFTISILASYILFLEPDQFDRILARIGGPSVPIKS